MKKVKQTNYQKIAEEIINFLQSEFRKRNTTKAIIGVSGGVDSAVTAFLCKKAELDLYTTILPYRKRGLKEAKEVIKRLSLPKDRIIHIDITPFVDIQIKELQKVVKLNRISIGNIFPRQRMIIQYAIASCLNGLVVGTQHLSEYYLGYFTLYGDQACDICPIAGLWKTQIYQLAKCLGVPELVINRKATGDLWPRLTDEKDLGFKYKDADKILYLFLSRQCPKKEIISKYGFSSKLVDKVLERVRITNYKREDLPRCYFR